MEGNGARGKRGEPTNRRIVDGRKFSEKFFEGKEEVLPRRRTSPRNSRSLAPGPKAG
jgi:hypothetical protein